MNDLISLELYNNYIFCLKLYLTGTTNPRKYVELKDLTFLVDKDIIDYENLSWKRAGNALAELDEINNDIIGLLSRMSYMLVKNLSL